MARAHDGIRGHSLMAKKPHLWKPGSFKPLRVDGKRDKAERYIVTHGKNAGAIISKAERIRRVFGLHPTKLAAERKAGRLGYGPKAEERAISKSVETRRRLSRKGVWLHPDEVRGRHVFLNKAGVEQRATTKGRDLAIMQTFREDVHGRFDVEGNQTVPGALQTGDGSALTKYDRMKIYDVDGNRIYPETNIKKLRRWRDGKTVGRVISLKASCSNQTSDKPHEALCTMFVRRMSSLGPSRRWQSMRELFGTAGKPENICSWCGVQAPFHGHHKDGRKVSNKIVIICQNCHAKYHSKRK
jgi:hypothetical protein